MYKYLHLRPLVLKNAEIPNWATALGTGEDGTGTPRLKRSATNRLSILPAIDT
jgi:hypothetical protein